MLVQRLVELIQERLHLLTHRIILALLAPAGLLKVRIRRMERRPCRIHVHVLKLPEARRAKDLVDVGHGVGAELGALEDHQAVPRNGRHALLELQGVHAAEEAMSGEVRRGPRLDEAVKRIAGLAFSKVLRLFLELGEGITLGDLTVVAVVGLEALGNTGEPLAGLGVDADLAAFEALVPLARADLRHEHVVLETRPTGMR
mmetsp:Transcript_20908/g.55871  ORF Transcript_20908/g.55871 Transcript_20908/m.55871 type:complete len:201 (+) Transcript_20908:239-841(+)